MQQHQSPAPHSSIQGSYRADPCAQGATPCLGLELLRIPHCSDPWKGMSCHPQNPGSHQSLWLPDTCSLSSSTTKFVFSFPSPNICHESTEKPTMGNTPGPPPAGSSLSADCCPEWGIPSSCSAKQGQSPQDLWTPGAIPCKPSSSTFPKSFCPFTTDEMASG